MSQVRILPGPLFQGSAPKSADEGAEADEEQFDQDTIARIGGALRQRPEYLIAKGLFHGLEAEPGGGGGGPVRSPRRVGDGRITTRN